jgi:hypothetical protein
MVEEQVEAGRAFHLPVNLVYMTEAYERRRDGIKLFEQYRDCVYDALGPEHLESVAADGVFQIVEQLMKNGK